jgi:FMN phosphatase YigB (HAD superfamily)
VLRAAVFDLDHTLFDPRTLPSSLFGALEARLRLAAAGVIAPDILEAVLADAWRLPFDRVAALYQLPAELTASWQEAMSMVEVSEPLTPYPDVYAGLEQLPVSRFLLTTGFRRLQASKVHQLGLTPLFAAVYVDALDSPGPVGKRALLERVLLEQALTPQEVVVLGDRADDELAAARTLGMVAVQVLRPGVSPSPEIPWQVPDLWELPALFTRVVAASAT